MNLLSKYKKLFFVLGFVLITILLGYLIFSLFFKGMISPTDTTPTATSTDSSGLPSSSSSDFTPSDDPTEPAPLSNNNQDNQKISEAEKIARGGLTQTTKLTDTPSIGITLQNNGLDLQYYDKNEGKFFQIDKNGKKQELSDKVFYNVQKVTWSPNKTEAILEYPDGSNIIYDFDNKKQTTLPKYWEDFNFSPTGDQMVLKSMGKTAENNWLTISNDSGNQTRQIEFIGENADTVYPSWSTNNQTIAMYKKGIDFDRQEIFFVGLHDENFKSLVIDGRGFQHKWSKEGNKLLYSVYSSDNDMKPKLWIANAKGDNIGTGKKDLSIATWADKCVFANGYDVYCAVPKTLDTGAGLFPELGEQSIDNLYKINTQTGYKKLIAVPEENVNMSNLTITENDMVLYFTDTHTQEIHKINLK